MFYCFLFCLPLSCVGVNLQVYLQNYLFLFSPQPKDPFKLSGFEGEFSPQRK